SAAFPGYPVAAVRLRARDGRHARHRVQFHAGEPSRRPRLRLARPASQTDGSVSARVQSLAFRGWWEDRVTAAREARRYARIFGRNGASVAGLVLVTMFLVVALIGPRIVPSPEDAAGAGHLDRKLQAPSRAHWFGTDEVGDDVYSRVVLGARLSLQIGLVITLIAAVIGVPLGVVAGYVRGAVGEVIMRVTDVFLAVPALVLAVAVVSALGSGIVNAILAIALVWWPGYVRLVQGKALAISQESFVEAARAVGVGRVRIAFVHLLPNCLSPILVKTSMYMGTAILTSTILFFIWLEAQPPIP